MTETTINSKTVPAAASSGNGNAYDTAFAVVESELTAVERGTPGGEMLRRYWHPVALAAEVRDAPLAIRALGEDLILFRTGAGKLGLVYPNCVHRGSSLYYGKVEQEGIRCCYHGWLFGVQGRCLEQPCEPDGGVHRGKVRQPWYPVREEYGLVFAYMGPPELEPALPRYDVLENLGEGERLHADGNSIGSGGAPRMPCNWLQTHENVLDSWHVFVLHSTFSTTQFSELMAVRPDIDWQYLESGASAIQLRQLPDGEGSLRRVVEVAVPNVRIVPDPRLKKSGPSHNVAWTLPIDRTNTRIFTVIRMGPQDVAVDHESLPMYAGKAWRDLSPAEHQRYPGDYEAQVSQGEVTAHNREHLVSSDRGVAMFRRLLKQAITETREGRRPVNTAPPDVGHLHTVRAGNFFQKPENA